MEINCTAVEVAECEAECVERVRLTQNHEAYEFIISNLKSRVETAKKGHCKLQQWVSIEEEAKYPSWVKELEHQTAQLLTRKI